MYFCNTFNDCMKSSIDIFWKVFVLVIVSTAVMLHVGCRPDDSITDMPVRLRLSSDTLRFDTVFTERGTITRFVKIYNDHSSSIQIEDIQLANPSSPFRFNINGFTNIEDAEIIIESGDSIYLFMEATIDPDMPLSVSPFVIEDRLDLTVNGEITPLYIEAFGQNAVYLPRRNAKGAVSVLSCDLGTITFDDPRPYVIYGILAVDSCTLVIPAGKQIYVHGGLVRDETLLYTDGLILMLQNGRLLAQGTADNRITFRSDRLEPVFDDVPGQWNGIRFLGGSQGHVLSHVDILHAGLSVLADSATSLQMDHSSIQFSAGEGLRGVQSTINGTNNLIHSSGTFAMRLAYGGNYTFEYTTLASYSNNSEALLINNYICVDPNCEMPMRRSAPLTARFTNCIIAGGDSDEIALDELSRTPFGEEVFDVLFDHCAVRVDELLDADNYPNFFDQCISCINLMSRDTTFVDVNAYDFRPDSLSVFDGKAVPTATRTDILGNLRDAFTPDLGCFEVDF